MKNKIYLLIGGIFIASSLGTYLYIVNYVSDNVKNISVPSNTPLVLSPEVISEAVEKPQIDIAVPETAPVLEETHVLSFAAPVNGEIGLAFSPSNLIYSKTLKEWITHKGIDIMSPAGTPVLAAENGIIKEINNTPSTGIEIVIEHKDGYKTVYSNLSSEKMVKINQKIKKGDTISGIGRTSSFEASEPDHLHFEIYKDNTIINPTTLIKTN